MENEFVMQFMQLDATYELCVFCIKLLTSDLKACAHWQRVSGSPFTHATKSLTYWGLFGGII